MKPIDHDLKWIACGLALWLLSFAAAAAHSLAAPTGLDDLGRHLPLIVMVLGGTGALIGALVKAVQIVWKLYDLGIAKHRVLIREEVHAALPEIYSALQKHASKEQTMMAATLRRTAKIERIVDRRGKGNAVPFSAERHPDEDPPELRLIEELDREEKP